MKKRGAPIHHRIIHHIRKYHRIRKKKESGLPNWKERWHHFNEKYLGWLEHFVEFMIPWMVLALLFILIGEFSHELNFFHWHWLDAVSEFFEYYHSFFEAFDRVIISFFVIDLYFNFFKKKRIMTFIKTSILYIIAVAPMGALFDIGGGLAETQRTIHVTTELEKEAARLIRGEEAIAKITKAEEAAKIARLESSGSRIARVFARFPRFFRLNRLADFFVKKKK
ncbi:MAG: hypothetical protein QW666_02205 [Candidatus Woesearchaeota archaeon]